MAVGVAEALDYLHNSASQPVIHRDVKSSNILLSDDFEPQVKTNSIGFFIYQIGRLKKRESTKNVSKPCSQLSDFGLARWASISTTHIICSDVAGTFGYGRLRFVLADVS